MISISSFKIKFLINYSLTNLKHLAGLAPLKSWDTTKPSVVGQQYIYTYIYMLPHIGIEHYSGENLPAATYAEEQ